MKALRQTKKRTAQNKIVRETLKRTLKNARKAASTKSAEAESLLKATVQMLDKSVKKKVLKKNAAARTKSRLMKLWQKTS